MSDDGKKLSEALDDPLSVRDPNRKEWVKFEDENHGNATPKSNEKVKLLVRASR